MIALGRGGQLQGYPDGAVGQARPTFARQPLLITTINLSVAGITSRSQKCYDDFVKFEFDCTVQLNFQRTQQGVGDARGTEQRRQNNRQNTHSSNAQNTNTTQTHKTKQTQRTTTDTQQTTPC